MADNYTSNLGAGGPLYRSTDLGVGLGHFPHVKVSFGASGLATDVTTTVGLPVAPLASSIRIGLMQLTGGATSAALGLGGTFTAYGNMRVTAEPTGLFNDPFDGAVIDTTNRWNAAVVSGMTVTQSSGGLNVNGTTVAGNSAFIDTLPTFAPLGVNFTAFAAAAKLEAQTANLFATNAHRFFGLGNRPATFAIGTPLLDAIGFEIDTTGQLLCCVYSNGTRVYSTSVSLLGANLNTLVTPSSGYCRFGMAIRADTIVFYIGTTEYPAASFSVSSATFTLPNVQSLPIRAHAINSATAPAAAASLVITTLALGDTGGNAITINDGTFGWRKTTVKAGNTAAVAADNPLVVALHPSSPVAQAAITKGTQGATGVTTQELKNAGRNTSNFFMAVPVLNTAAEALQSLTGYKSGAAVAATTTPAVVTTGKTLNLQFVTLTFITTAAAGYTRFTLRANTAGVAAVGSPAVASWLIGGNSSATAGLVQQMVIAIPDGMEFAAGTGIAVTAISYSATGVATATGYSQLSLHGYEY